MSDSTASTTLDRPAARPSGRQTLVAGAPQGLDALYLAERIGRGPGQLVHVARDAGRMARLAAQVPFFAPGVEVLTFPAWDCLPYDRVSPNQDVVARRLEVLSALAAPPEGGRRRPRLLVTTVNALVQKVPPPDAIRAALFSAAPGGRTDRDALLGYLERNGYVRTGTVVEAGEYAVRGGIVDVFPAGAERPLRLDFFGNVVEAIREFDPLTQRSLGRVDRIDLKPVGEVMLDPAAIERFRVGYLQRFGAVTGDPLFEAVTAGRKFPGMEHWLPLFHERLVGLLDYLDDGAPIGFDHLAEGAIATRLETIGEHYRARSEPEEHARAMASAPYRPLPPDMLYLDEHALEAAFAGRERLRFSPYAPSPADAAGPVEDLGGRPARDFAAERARPDVNLFDAVVAHIRDEQRQPGRRVLLAAHGEGSLDRLRLVLGDHGLDEPRRIDRWDGLAAGEGPAIAVLPLDHGFVADGASVLAEQDILGDRLTRPARRTRRSDKFLAEVTALSEGDLVVHADHGIGRFDGLVTLEVGGAPHDCLRLTYHGGDRLFVPVENLDVLSRYGATADGESVQLDRLGGLGWQQRKARVKERVREIAGDLIRVAARRHARRGLAMTPPPGLYEEFCARFPYDETEDQRAAIEDVLADLAAGHPMDRLVCGDVGFGKTEVALRAAFVAAMNGKQVALLAPTTLLARQHHNVFRERFAGLPVRIEQLSRFATAKQATEVKRGLASGAVDIAIGTHALLGKGVGFKDLGLVVIDEEQHFGVAHKERLKQLRAEVHVLTMTATPIPRTLQMAFGGLKDLSLIATPPVDRLAVRTFVLPSDPLVLREAILREHYRGGQTFYVCPKVADQPKLKEDLGRLVPEVKIAVANGRLPPRELEEVMAAFYDRQVDLLLTTNIIESGLDIPTANTLVVHRADMFGLSQLYQLRGRVGRAKQRGYAYFTLPPKRALQQTAERRLQVINALDGLGAGFQLASHDLDIRGAGNLLGEEQSGHVKEVGFELYQHMLEEAVEALREEAGGAAAAAAADWTPQITIDAAALIPDAYVGDLDLRLSLYRRLAALAEPDELEAFAAELVDRFGPLPQETEQLLKLVGIKQLCRKAGVAKVEAGPKGVVLAFHNDRFARPERLVDFIGRRARSMRLRPDHRLVIAEPTASPQERLKRVRGLVDELARLAA